MKTYTVIGHYEDTAQVFCTFVQADNAYAAMQAAANEPENIQDLTIIGAIEGEHTLTSACEDSDKSACAVDLLAD